MKKFIDKYVGDKAFYLKTFSVGIPLALQMLLASCMSIIDTMMVSSIGMVGAVGNASQLITLNDGISWGILAGISMFSSQFYGGKQIHNLKKAFGLNLILSISISTFWIIITYLFGEEILYFYLPDETVVYYSFQYLKIAIFSTMAFAITNAFSAMFRSMQNTKLVLFVSIFGMISNVCLNALFIYVLEFGVTGAALGTLISQILVTTIYIGYSIKTKQVFMGSIKEIFGIDKEFYMPIVKKMLPLVLNETAFGFGMTLFVKAYGYLGSESMEAYYIANQVYMLFLFIVHGYGGAVTILVGTRLGEGRIEQAKKESNYQIFLGGIIGSVMMFLMFTCSRYLLPLFSVKSDLIADLATGLLMCLSIKVILRMFNFVMFSTLRAGGDSKVLSFLDAGIMYLVGIPLAFISVLFFEVNSIVIVILIVQIEQLIRMILTMRRYKSYKWLNDLTKLVK